jgi:hypothetical protein
VSGGGGAVGPDGLTDAQRRARAVADGRDPSAPETYSQEQQDNNARSRAAGNNAPMVSTLAERTNPTGPKLDPTLTDMLLRDVASGQVRRIRAGSRRGTFGGRTGNPYDTPTLGG